MSEAEINQARETICNRYGFGTNEKIFHFLPVHLTMFPLGDAFDIILKKVNPLLLEQKILPIGSSFVGRGNFLPNTMTSFITGISISFTQDL